MTERIYISHHEHVLLIRETTAQREPVATGFGGGRVWLARDDDGAIVSAWALPLLAEWRGYTVQNGAGV